MRLATRSTPVFLMALALVALSAAPARSADVAAPTVGPFALFEEIRGGVFDEDPSRRYNDSVAGTIEALSSPLTFYSGDNPYLAAFLNPRLNIGGMIDFEGRTSYAYSGVTWRVPIYDRLFGEGEFGGAVNDSVQGRPGWLGCPVTFRESIGLGIQISSNIDVVASVEHVSHANLCGHINPGLTSFGLRLGYKF